MRFIDIDTLKPDMESLKAAAELLDQDYPIVFPSDTTYGIVMRFSPANAAALHKIRREDKDKPFLIVISEDFDWRSLTKADALPRENFDATHKFWPGPTTLVFPKETALTYPVADSIAIRMPADRTNRAFHTLVQLCDFPLLAPSFNRPGEPVITEKTVAVEKFPEIDYAFWDERYQAQQPSAIWDLRTIPATKLR